MVAAVVIALVVVLIFVAIIAYPALTRRTAREPVAVRASDQLDSGTTGDVEIITTVPAGAASRIVGPAVGAVAPIPAVPTIVPAAPAPAPALFDLEQEPPAVPPAPIRWCKQFDPRSGGLDDTARLRLIGDLGVVAKEWCVPLLAQAYEEEHRPGHRQAALTALAACRSRNAIATFRLALAAGDPAECAIATDALADLEPPPQSKPRTVVERR